MTARVFMPFPLPHLIVANLDWKIQTRGEDQPNPEVTFSYESPFREAKNEVS